MRFFFAATVIWFIDWVGGVEFPTLGKRKLYNLSLLLQLGRRPGSGSTINRQHLTQKTRRPWLFFYLISGLTHGGFLVVAGNVMPFDSVSVEVIQDSKTGLLMGWVFTGSSVIRLRKSSSSCVGPVRWCRERNWLGGGVWPVDHFVGMVDNTTSPEVSLSILSYQPVESVLFGRRIKRYWFHVHRIAIGTSLMLLEFGAANLPGGDISSQLAITRICPEMIGGCCST